MPEMIDVVSSNVARMGYDEEARELHVIYKSSEKVYVYIDFSPLQWSDLNGTASIGRAMAQIKRRHEFRVL